MVTVCRNLIFTESCCALICIAGSARRSRSTYRFFITIILMKEKLFNAPPACQPATETYTSQVRYALAQAILFCNIAGHHKAGQRIILSWCKLPVAKCVGIKELLPLL